MEYFSMPLLYSVTLFYSPYYWITAPGYKHFSLPSPYCYTHLLIPSSGEIIRTSYH